MSSLANKIPLVIAGALLSFFVSASDSVSDRIDALTPIIGGYPPNIGSEEEHQAVEKRYLDIKHELDDLIQKSPNNEELLFHRGRLQSMGHNFDYPDAWQGASDDLRAVLSAHPDNIQAAIELASLWVNSNPDLAEKAEMLFRGAQCFNGKEPLEDAQRGIFFALYYQGKAGDALRQAEYLVQQWPAEERYQSLRDMVHQVLSRKEGVSAPPVIATAPMMASCEPK